MKILYISRSTLYQVKGGDTIQIIKTAEEVRKLGVSVDIRLSNDETIQYGQYDLIHFFNIIRPADIIKHIKKSKLPFVVSTIYLSFEDFENNNKYNLKDAILKWFSPSFREYIKAIARSVLNKEKIVSKEYLFWGHKKSINYIIDHAAMLLPNSESEFSRLKKDFPHARKYSVIPNAADTSFFFCNQDDIDKKEKNMVLCVARIEGRKNQLQLIHALNNTPYELYIVGMPAPNHIAYFEECKKVAASNIHFLDYVDMQLFKDYYLRAKVHILPSWFETTGLSTLEALFCGCNIVITPYGDTLDYFNTKNTFVCQPDDTQSILESIEQASAFENKVAYFSKETQEFSWQNAGLRTYDAYKKILAD